MTQLMREAVEALRQFIEEKVNYMRINHLGDPEKTHTVKYGRIALSHLTEELRRQESAPEFDRGMKYQGESYSYMPPTDELIRNDVVKLVMKLRRKPKGIQPAANQKLFSEHPHD